MSAERPPTFERVVVAADGREGGADAAALAQALADPGGAVVPVSASGATPAAHVLRDAAVRSRADLLVVGSSRRGHTGQVVAGRDVRAIVRAAPCAVAIATVGYAAGPRELGRIGVGVDGTPASQAAVAVALELARRVGRRLEVVELPPPGDEATRLPALRATSTDLDLLVLGAHRRAAARQRGLGVVAEELAHGGSAPLLLVRPAIGGAQDDEPPVPRARGRFRRRRA